MNLLKPRYVVLLFVLIIFTSCGDKNNLDDNAEIFSNDKTKLGISISDEVLGIKFNPPIDWELTPSSLSKKVENRNNSNDGFIYQPVYIFFNRESGSVLSCGKVISSDSSLSKSSQINFYKGMLTSKYKNSNLQLNEFINTKVAFTHLKYEKENLEAIKLFFNNNSGQIIQLEYSYRKNFVDSVSAAIKASIGSIRVIN